MEQDKPIIRERLKSPRAAAVAGILFSVLYFVSLILIQAAVPENPAETGEWLKSGWASVNLGLNLLPFAGIAFLWFIGVVRDHLSHHEDRLFATVFLGSGLLFLAMQFAAAAVAGGIISVFGTAPATLLESGMYAFGRAITYEITHTYAMKMAGLFMMSISTLALRTGIFPRWMIYVGYILAAFLLFSVGFFYWSPLVFPLWTFLISIYILYANLKRSKE